MSEYIVKETGYPGAVKQEVVGELIRCKDCKHYNAGFECLIEGYGIERSADWYCGDAERREEGEQE